MTVIRVYLFTALRVNYQPKPEVFSKFVEQFHPLLPLFSSSSPPLAGYDSGLCPVWKQRQMVLTHCIKHKFSQTGMGIGTEANLSSKV